jgi:DNA-binding response OmpR family regulator
MNKILIVEDEQFLMQALKDSLKQEGFLVESAVNGDEAMDRIEEQHPDLILLDLLMPKRDGFYVLEELKKNPKLKSIRIITLSNLGEDSEIKRALEMGSDDYFVKSQHSIEEIIIKIKSILKNKKND